MMTQQTKIAIGGECYLEVSQDEILLTKYEDGVCDRKRVEFPLYRWKSFEDTFTEIDQVIEEIRGDRETCYRHHIGGNIYVSISKQYPSVDVRQFWKPHGKPDILPSRRGVPLRLQQFEAIKKVLPQLRKLCPKLEKAVPCYQQESHHNFLGLHQCFECTPNSDYFCI